MKQYHVKITNEALLDMEMLYKYIALELLAPDNAIDQYNRIADAIFKLDNFPERFQIFDSNLESIKELRRMPVDNYSVFYAIKGNSVIITGVLYSASDIFMRIKE